MQEADQNNKFTMSLSKEQSYVNDSDTMKENFITFANRNNEDSFVNEENSMDDEEDREFDKLTQIRRISYESSQLNRISG